MSALIIGAGIFAFILLYFGSQLDKKEHFALRLLLFSLAILSLIVIGKGVIDSNTVCDVVVHEHEYQYFQGADTFAGLTIGAHHPTHVILNGMLNFYITVYDENGKRKTNSSTTCEYGVTDSQGEIIYINNATNYNGFDNIWLGAIPNATLNHTGLWTYQLFCVDANNGGYFLGALTVTENGEFTDNNSESALICKARSSNTARTFYRFTVLVFLLYMTYVLYYLVYWAVNLISKKIRGQK